MGHQNPRPLAFERPVERVLQPYRNSVTVAVHPDQRFECGYLGGKITGEMLEKALKKFVEEIEKAQNKLNAAEDAALDNNKLDYQTVALKNWRMLDELDALHISVYGNGDMSLDAQ